MEGSAIAPPHQVAQKRFMIAAMILGAAGSLIAIAAFGANDYRVGPMILELKMMPSTSGTTELAVEPVRTLRPGYVKADTHTGFLSFRATLIAIQGDAVLPAVTDAIVSPHKLATKIQEQGKDAAKRFGLRIGLLTLAGGASGGMAIALVGMKARRVLQGAAAGLILVALLGLVAWQTYDTEAFSKVQFRQAGQSAPLLGR